MLKKFDETEEVVAKAVVLLVEGAELPIEEKPKPFEGVG